MRRSLPPFRQRFPWLGGDLQTIATALLPARDGFAPLVTERMEFVLDDGDTLLAALDRPRTPEPGRALVILIHGVPGSEDSPYMFRMSGRLLKQGHCVLRLNLRGAGPSRATCRGQYYAGSSPDIGAVLAELPRELIGNGIMAVGYSLGGAILLKYLGEKGSHAPLRAAASVSAPIDLMGTCLELMRFRNGLYHYFLLRGMKAEATAKGAGLTPAERGNILASRTLWQYDDLFTAPRNHYSGGAEYYYRCSAIDFLPGIRVPTLVLSSLDDPWVPGGAYSGHYWGSNKSLSLLPLLPSRGGHVGFHGRGSELPWSDLAVTKFLSTHARPMPAQ